MLKCEIQILKKERDDFKLKVDELNLIKDEQIKKLEENYKQLNEEKMKIIDDLISKMNTIAVGINTNTNDILSKGEKIIAINFASTDQHINHTIICKNKSVFHEIEGRLYAKYPEYLDDNNYFMFNNIKINRQKTLEENGINGYNIILNKKENK